MENVEYIIYINVSQKSRCPRIRLVCWIIGYALSSSNLINSV